MILGHCWKKLNEIKSKGVNISEKNLIISDSVSLILPFHSQLDEIREDSSENLKLELPDVVLGQRMKIKLEDGLSN